MKDTVGWWCGKVSFHHTYIRSKWTNVLSAHSHSRRILADKNHSFFCKSKFLFRQAVLPVPRSPSGTYLRQRESVFVINQLTPRYTNKWIRRDRGRAGSCCDGTCRDFAVRSVACRGWGGGWGGQGTMRINAAAGNNRAAGRHDWLRGAEHRYNLTPPDKQGHEMI